MQEASLAGPVTSRPGRRAGGRHTAEGARLAAHETGRGHSAFAQRSSSHDLRSAVLGRGHRDLLIVPDARHSLEALDDSAVLLTVAKRP
jgi:hypothetical protein